MVVLKIIISRHEIASFVMPSCVFEAWHYSWCSHPVLVNNSWIQFNGTQLNEIDQGCPPKLLVLLCGNKISLASFFGNDMTH